MDNKDNPDNPDNPDNSETFQLKYKKYINKYIPNDLYWGIGIENETYLQFKEPIEIKYISHKDFLSKFKRERYSVDYYQNYNMSMFEKVLYETYLFNIIMDNKFNIPFMLNSYSLKNTDLYGNHSTLFKKNEDDNGYKKIENHSFQKSIYDSMCCHDKYFSENYEKDFVFDGDSIEFMTQNFYKTNPKDVCNELLYIKTNFISKFNNFLENHYKKDFKLSLKNFGKVTYPDSNHGMVSFFSNKGNISICNNSTYHINITLPTHLDQNCNIKNETDFVIIHQNAIKVIQSLLPLLVACYGTGDFLSKLSNEPYFKGSLRNGMSRYISIGTYDTDTMKEGKLLDNFQSKNCIWFDRIKTNNNCYKLNDKIGYDFNFRKYKKTGFELRCLDWFPEKYLESFINFILLLCSFSQDAKSMFNFNNVIRKYNENENNFNMKDNIIENKIWNDIVEMCIIKGSNCQINKNIFYELFGLTEINKNETETPYDILFNINNLLYDKYMNSWLISIMSPTFKKPIIVNYNKIN